LAHSPSSLPGGRAFVIRRAVARIELDPIEVKKLVALGYLDPAARGDKEPAFDASAGTYLSDKLAGEPAALVATDCTAVAWQHPVASLHLPLEAPKKLGDVARHRSWLGPLLEVAGIEALVLPRDPPGRFGCPR